MIISQFRWLDGIVDCKKFADKLFEILALDSLSSDVRKDAISLIPDVFDENTQKVVLFFIFMLIERHIRML